MAPKRRRSSAGSHEPASKKPRARHPTNTLSTLTDELLVRILHHLPISTLLQCHLLSHRFYRLAGDSQIWKSLYYSRFVLPRALRIPGIKASSSLDNLHFSSRRSKWLDDNTLVERKDGKTTNWKGQYKLRHNWSIGACEVQEIHVSDRPSVPSMLVRLAEGVVITADKEEGLRAWDLKEKRLIAKCGLGEGVVPTCLAIDEQISQSGLGIAVGFMDGGWRTWCLACKEEGDRENKVFLERYLHPKSSNGMLGAVAYAHPYLLTITDAQLLSLYTFDHKQQVQVKLASVEYEEEMETSTGPESTPQEEQLPPPSESKQPTLLASLKSHTSWPPLSLSIRSTPDTLIASIAYSLPTYLSGYTIGLQELHLCLLTGQIIFSRLASALPEGFTSLSSSLYPSPNNSGTSTPVNLAAFREGGTRNYLFNEGTRPTCLSYSHPYILATHPDNTLTLYLCQSTPSSLSISPGTKLWGHTSSVSSAEITPRGKAVSVSLRGSELRVWELEGSSGSGSSSRKRLFGGKANSKVSERSVRIRPSPESKIQSFGHEIEGSNGSESEERGRLERASAATERIDDAGMEVDARKQWVGFDDEVVIVLKESEKGTQALMVYDFT